MKTFATIVLGLITGVLLALALNQGLNTFFAVKLPTPPDLTVVEMQNRIEDYCVFHMKNCETCKKYMEERPNLSPPPCYIEARNAGLKIGDWTMIGCRPNGVTCLWQYTGRIIPGWAWSNIGQCWKQIRTPTR